MSTRGMIQVFDPKNRLLARIYVHGDMYPDNGMMCEVARFLSDRYLVNGITDHFKDVNLMDNLAALIVAHLVNWNTKVIRRFVKGKRNSLAAGFVYLYPFDLDIKDTDVEYIYELHPTMDEEALYKAAVSDNKAKALDVIQITAKRYEWWDGKGPTDFFEGTLRDFAKQYCKF